MEGGKPMTTTRKPPKKPKGRPLHLKDFDPHHDQCPCPPWCWVITDNSDGLVHDTGGLEPSSLYEAVHGTNRAYSVAASQYEADHRDRGAGPATLELHLPTK